jgi:CysZ protein
LVIQDFAAGFSYLLRGFRLLREPGLRAYVVVPLLINIVVFAGLIWAGAAGVDHLLHSLLPDWHELWTGIIVVLAFILFGVIAGVLVFFTFTMVANVIGAPFNDFLSEKVERRLARDLQAPPRSSHLLADFVPSILGELGHLFYYLIFAVLLLFLSFIFNLIPGLVILTSPLWLLFGSWMLALEYLSYPMGNHNHHFPEVRRWLRNHRSLGLGFGFATTLAAMIPLVNFLVMPAAVAGATALWVDRGDTGMAHG